MCCALSVSLLTRASRFVALIFLHLKTAAVEVSEHSLADAAGSDYKCSGGTRDASEGEASLSLVTDGRVI